MNRLLFLKIGTLTHNGISQRTSHSGSHGDDDFQDCAPQVFLHGFSVFTDSNKNKDKPQ